MTRLGKTCAVVGLMRAWASMTARQSGGSVRGFRDRRARRHQASWARRPCGCRVALVGDRFWHSSEGFGTARTSAAIQGNRRPARRVDGMPVLDPGCVKTPIGPLTDGNLILLDPSTCGICRKSGLCHSSILEEVVLRVPDAPEFSHGSARINPGKEEEM